MDPDVDVVSIASYDECHYSQVMMALANKKHVFVEKPLCLTQQELGDIRSGLEKAGNLRLSSNLILRKTPRFVELHQKMRAGLLGRPYLLEGDYNYGRIHKIVEGWRGATPGYSVMHGGGIHMIDLILWLLGEKPHTVMAVGSGLCTKKTRFTNNDCVVALLKFPGGATAKISANFGCVFPHFHNLTVYGTEASFQHGWDGARLFTSRDPAAMPMAIESPYPGVAKGDMLPAFVAAILDGTDPDVDENDVFDCMAVSIAIERAVQLEQIIKVGYS
jgi:predicted dehydrogenase